MSHFGTWSRQRHRAAWLENLTAPLIDLEAFLTSRQAKAFLESGSTSAPY
jgi:hypothetical protein